jgi:hypothetical protein
MNNGSHKQSLFFSCFILMMADEPEMNLKILVFSAAKILDK